MVGAELDWYRSGGELIELHDDEEDKRFLAFQFDRDRGRVHPVVAYANRKLGAVANPKTMTDWWTTPNQLFDERNPIDLLKAGKFTETAVRLDGGDGAPAPLR